MNSMYKCSLIVCMFLYIQTQIYFGIYVYICSYVDKCILWTHFFFIFMYVYTYVRVYISYMHMKRNLMYIHGHIVSMLLCLQMRLQLGMCTYICV